MPELPEVEAARRAIEENCIGKKIKKAIIADDPKVIDGVSPSDFEAALVGKTIVSALRKGKNMWLQLDSSPFPSFQFGMTGAIYIKGVAVTKYKRRVIFLLIILENCMQLDDGLELSFTDKRRFAKVRLLEDPASKPPISELGPDALLEPMTVDELHGSLSRKKIAIKTLLLDQSFVSGIGNWVADEVLYQTILTIYVRSAWFKFKCSITRAKAERTQGLRLEFIHCRLLLACPEKVLQLYRSPSRSRENICRSFNIRLKLMLIATAFLLNGCFILDGARNQEKLMVIEKAIQVGADSSQFPSNWIFHSREKKSGKAFVDGKKIEFIVAGGRTTAYVPELQKLNGNQAGKAVGKPKTKISKKKRDDDNKDDGNEPASEEEEIAKKAKSKRELRPKSPGKKPSAKRKSKASDDDSEDDNEEDDVGAAAGDDDQKKKPGRVANKKQAMVGKASKKLVKNQNTKKPNKKAK
ncbi:unnamed protein product [Dovyalis caffra]|uniref:Formamidopyrimidine-DNA glycosylase catalytic domain-containing protein n=1 Tax=Dovyalis caffra TaxID=77055 RepID=A0AAV1ST82_9ROSI|nr:unnamed protein product [Dovyalis caffra]